MVKEIKTYNKQGFSLAEALVSMLIVSIFFIATSKVASYKPRTEPQTNIHGYYECYVSGNTFTQKTDSGNASQVAQCIFNPPSGIAYSMVYTLNSGSVRLSVEPQFTSAMTINNSQGLIDIINQINAQGENTLGCTDLRAFLRQSYPTSSLLTSISNGNCSGPAIFIGW